MLKDIEQFYRDTILDMVAVQIRKNKKYLKYYDVNEALIAAKRKYSLTKQEQQKVLAAVGESCCSRYPS